jgi:hypothetical protein
MNDKKNQRYYTEDGREGEKQFIQKKIFHITF